MDLAAASASATQIRATLDGAASNGVLRLVVAIGIVVLAVFVVWMIRRRRRSNRVLVAETAPAPAAPSFNDVTATVEVARIEPTSTAETSQGSSGA
jgi:hypothetical protein